MVNKSHLLTTSLERKRLIKVQTKTNPNYGKKPNERTIKELINNGFINLDKPSGPTSHQVDSWIKNIFNIDKVGHSGTLDPNATGVLPVALENGTRALNVLLSLGKEYIGIMTLHKHINREKIINTTKKFIGEINQIPPVRSAVKRVMRKRSIYYLDIIQIKDKDVLFRVGCESGTYVRTLCVDIGRKIKTGAHLSELRRTKVGRIIEENSVLLHDIKDAYIFWKKNFNEEELRKIIMPMEKILDDLPKIVIRDSAVDAICHGANLALPGIVELDTEIKKGDKVALLTLKGEGVAIGESLMTTEELIQKDTGFCARPLRVLMNKGTYPSIWKKT